MDLNKKLEELKPYQLNCNVFDVYSYNGLSMQELLCQFFTKINECINVSNETIDLAKWLVNEGLEIEVVKKLMIWLEDGTLENIINVNLFNSLNNKIDDFGLKLETIQKSRLISVKDYGAIGNGENDDTQAIMECFNYCTDNGYTMYFPNGEYILNHMLKKANHPITDYDNAIKPIYITGESAFGVKINTTNGTKPLIDVSRSRTVYMSNIMSDNSWFHCIQYGDDFKEFSRLRDVQLYNVMSLSTTESFPSWNVMINTPAPTNYNVEENDSRYNRYPIEITSNSGYNPIMINNFANENQDGSLGQPSDNSSIGIIDRVTNSTGVILVDCNTRSSFQVQSNQESVSGIRNNVVYEVGADGSVAVGCSVMNNDTVAPGDACLKLRRKYPSIKLYDHNRGNRQFIISSADDISSIKTFNESGDYKCGLEMNYKTSVNKFKGSVQLGDLLTWNTSNQPAKDLTGISSIYVTSNTTSRLENIIGGVEGQIVSIVSDGSITVNHHRDSWGNIRTSTKADIVLSQGTVYTLTKINGLWYLK